MLDFTIRQSHVNRTFKLNANARTHFLTSGSCQLIMFIGLGIEISSWRSDFFCSKRRIWNNWYYKAILALRLFDFLPATLIEIAVWKVKIYLSFIYLLNYVVVNAGEFGFQSELPFFSSIELNWGGGGEKKWLQS